MWYGRYCAQEEVDWEKKGEVVEHAVVKDWVHFRCEGGGWE